jgi:putative addiction module component (TIGR02574 family)
MNSQLLETLKSLPVPDRIELIEKVWDSIATVQEQFEVSQPQQAELERRLDALEQGQSRLSTWEEAKARILAGR